MSRAHGRRKKKQRVKVTWLRLSLTNSLLPIDILLRYSMLTNKNIKVSAQSYLVTGPLREVARKDNQVKKVREFFNRDSISRQFNANLKNYRHGPKTIYDSFEWCRSVGRLHDLYAKAVRIYGTDEEGNYTMPNIKLLSIGCPHFSIIHKICQELNFPQSMEFTYFTRLNFYQWQHQRREQDKDRGFQDGEMVRMSNGVVVYKEFVKQWHVDRLRQLRDKARGIDRRWKYISPRYIVDTPESSESEYSSDEEENVQGDVDVTTH